MTWNAADETPHALLIGSTVVPLVRTGETDGFLWAWDGGDDKLLVWPGGEFEEGELSDADGRLVGYVSPMSDMPEIDDLTAAYEGWQTAKDASDTDAWRGWLEAELQAHGRAVE